MFWIIFLGVVVFVSITVVFCLANKRNSERTIRCLKDSEVSWNIILVVSIIAWFIVIFSFIFIGANTYINLRSSKAEILALQSEIETIRSAQYRNVKSGEFIGGSLDNLNQSTNLSEYIKIYAEKKSKYNSDLERCKIYKEMIIYRWLGYGIFIPKKINDLEKL